MVGLGFGTLIGGRIAERWKKQIPYLYAAMEACIGIFGLCSIPLLRFANGFFATHFSIESIWIDFLINCVVLVFPILIMGMTTPIIVELMKTTLNRVGSIVGFYYGINVLGAAAGALATGIFFIELFGLRNTTVLAGCVNLFISVLFLLFTRVRKVFAGGKSFPIEKPSQQFSFSKAPANLLFASLAFGFVTLGLEMVLFRVVTNYFVAWPPLFAFMLAVFLLMLAVGEALFGAIVDRISPNRIIWLLLALFTGGLITSLIVLNIPLLYIHDHLKVEQFSVYNAPYKALGIVALFLSPVFFIAGFFPTVVKIAVKKIENVGSTFAGILFMFTVGNILGSFIVGLILFEYLGTIPTLICCCFILALGIYLLADKIPAKQRYSLISIKAALLVLLVIALPAHYFRQSTGYLKAHFKADVDPIEVIEDREAVTVVVPDKNAYQLRVFWDNSATANVSKKVGVNVWSLSQLMSIDPNFRPKRILQIGVGGNQFPYVMKEHDFVEKVTVVELTRAVLEGHKRWGHPELSAALIHGHPKVEYVVTDGRRFVQKALARHEKYDFIQVGVTNIKQAGTNNIYSIEFLTKLKKLLNPNGYIGAYCYTGLARMGLELFDTAFVFPANGTSWIYLTDKSLPPDGSVLEVSPKLAHFYRANSLDDLDKPLPAYGLNPLKVWIYPKSSFFDIFEISTDDNLSYEYRMLKTRRTPENNPEVYIVNQKNALHEERNYTFHIDEKKESF